MQPRSSGHNHPPHEQRTVTAWHPHTRDLKMYFWGQGQHQSSQQDPSDRLQQWYRACERAAWREVPSQHKGLSDSRGPKNALVALGGPPPHSGRPRAWPGIPHQLPGRAGTGPHSWGAAPLPGPEISALFSTLMRWRSKYQQRFTQNQHKGKSTGPREGNHTAAVEPRTKARDIKPRGSNCVARSCLDAAMTGP